MKSESNRPVAVEDLLRLKRAERPPAEFWTEFDRQLRAKQLAALVGKRPWWQTLPRAFASFARYRLPLGATALLAVGVLSVRHYQTASVTQPQTASARVAIADSPSSSATHLNASENAVLEVSSRVDAPVAVATQQEATLGRAAALVAETTVSNSFSGIEASLGIFGSEHVAGAQVPAGRYLGASLANAAAVPAPSRDLSGVFTGFETRAAPARTAVEPLQQMTPPGEKSRSRLLTAMVSYSPAQNHSHRANERSPSRITEERLYDQINRFGARGAGVQVKF